MKKITLVLPIAVIATLLLSGCALKKENSSLEKNSQEATSQNESGASCLVGTEKTVVGLKYTIIGTETYNIQGQSMDLCCWEVGEAQKKKKICSDRTTSPVGYSFGILWETDKNAGDYYKSMERYQEDGKSCQQFYNVDGTTGPKNCQ